MNLKLFWFALFQNNFMFTNLTKRVNQNCCSLEISKKISTCPFSCMYIVNATSKKLWSHYEVLSNSYWIHFYYLLLPSLIWWCCVQKKIHGHRVCWHFIQIWLIAKIKCQNVVYFVLFFKTVQRQYNPWLYFTCMYKIYILYTIQDFFTNFRIKPWVNLMEISTFLL